MSSVAHGEPRDSGTARREDMNGKAFERTHGTTEHHGVIIPEIDGATKCALASSTMAP